MWNKIGTKSVLWIKAARPETLIASISPIILGNIFAWKYGFFDVFLGIICLFFAIFLQVACNFSNDYYDFVRGSDKSEQGNPRFLADGRVSLNGMFNAMIITLIIATLMGIILVMKGQWWFSFIVTICLMSAFFYTGGRYPLAYYGLGDAFVFVFFGPMPMLGTFYVQTDRLSLDVLLVSISCGLIVDNILIINNCRDIKEDKASNKKTLIVRLGKKFGLYHFLANGILTSIIPLYLLKMGYSKFICLSLLLIPLFLWMGIKLKIAQTSLDYNKILSQSALAVAIFTCYQSIIAAM